MSPLMMPRRSMRDRLLESLLQIDQGPPDLSTYQFGSGAPFAESAPVRQSLSEPMATGLAERPGFGKRLVSSLADFARSGDFNFTKPREDAGGIASFLSGGLSAYGGIQGVREGRERETAAAEAAAADRSLRGRLIESQILRNERESARGDQGFEEWRRRYDYRRQNPLPAAGRSATDPNAVDQRAVVREAGRLYAEGLSGEGEYFETWDDAYAVALERFQTAGRLGGQSPPRPRGARPGEEPVAKPIRARAPEGAGRPPAGGGAPGGEPDVAVLSARARELKAEGKSDDEIRAALLREFGVEVQ